MLIKNSSIDSRLRNPVLDQKSSPGGKAFSSQRLRTKAQEMIRNYINIYIVFFSSLDTNHEKKFLKGSALYMIKVSVQGKKLHKHTQSKFTEVDKRRNSKKVS